MSNLLNKFIVYLALMALSIYFISCKKNESISYSAKFEECEKLIANIPKDDPYARYTVFPNCLVGAKFPRINEKSLEGKQVNEDYFKNKLTIVNFWFTNCKPCVAEIPGFNKIKERFGSDKINYLSIARDSKENIETFLKSTSWDFDHIPDAEALIKNQFKITVFPTTFVLNSESEIIYAFTGGSIDENAAQEIQDKLIPVIVRELELNI